jgi:hypothetical protein
MSYIRLRYLLTCEMLTVFIFSVLLVKSANSSKLKPNIGAIQHITCRLIPFHLYLLIQFEFVCTTYLFSWRSCFFSSFYYLTVILLYFYKCFRFYGTHNHNLYLHCYNCWWDLGGYHDKLGIETWMVSYLAKFALRKIIMFNWLFSLVWMDQVY